MARTGGSMKLNLHGAKLTAGAFSAGKLQEILHPHLHPTTEKKMLEGGFFGKLSGILDFANKAYSVIDKAIPIATKGYSAYKDISKGISGMKKKKDVPMEVMPEQQMNYGPKTGGGLEKEKSKRKLPEALRKRAEFIGKHMKGGKMTMNEASNLYKSQNK
jgi:hypothetical protein